MYNTCVSCTINFSTDQWWNNFLKGLSSYMGNAKITFIVWIHFCVLIQSNYLIKFQTSGSHMNTIRATRTCSYFLAKEKFITMCRNGPYENTVCRWLQKAQMDFICLICVLHLRALITQSSTLSWLHVLWHPTEWECCFFGLATHLLHVWLPLTVLADALYQSVCIRNGPDDSLIDSVCDISIFTIQKKGFKYSGMLHSINWYEVTNVLRIIMPSS
jgi:hypothetical protein